MPTFKTRPASQVSIVNDKDEFTKNAAVIPAAFFVLFSQNSQSDRFLSLMLSIAMISATRKGASASL